MHPLFKRLANKYKTPYQVQQFLYAFEYNKKNTVHSALTAIKLKSAHCLEGAFVAAAILEFNGYPPFVLSFESIDNLDHVIFVFQDDGLWGSVSKSRDLGLRGRAPVYRTLRDLAWSYYDPYVDLTGRITGYQLIHLDETKTNWRESNRNVFKAEKYLNKVKHIKLKSSDSRFQKLKNLFIKKGGLPIKKNWW
ncbi:MAG: hypothetical protein WA160_04780 [Pseudobdellovibrio sp.]